MIINIDKPNVAAGTHTTRRSRMLFLAYAVFGLSVAMVM